MATEAVANRTRCLILLLATLETVGDRLDHDCLDDLGLIVRIDELRNLVHADLQQLGREREANATRAHLRP